MELSEFVKQSLTQIVQGVKDAQQAVTQAGGVVNPSVSTTAAGNAETFVQGGKVALGLLEKNALYFGGGGASLTAIPGLPRH